MQTGTIGIEELSRDHVHTYMHALSIMLCPYVAESTLRGSTVYMYTIILY